MVKSACQKSPENNRLAPGRIDLILQTRVQERWTKSRNVQTTVNTRECRRDAGLYSTQCSFGE